jgi:hypothetical protein
MDTLLNENYLPADAAKVGRELIELGFSFPKTISGYGGNPIPANLPDKWKKIQSGKNTISIVDQNSEIRATIEVTETGKSSFVLEI